MKHDEIAQLETQCAGPRGAFLFRFFRKHHPNWTAERLLAAIVLATNPVGAESS